MERLPFQYQKRAHWRFFCPVCKVERYSYYWPSPRRRHYVSLAVFGAFMTGVLWPWTGFKGVFLVFPFWAVFEFAYRARARLSLICHRCGFDPFLFKYDVKLARKKVERFFAAKQQQRQLRQRTQTPPPT